MSLGVQMPPRYAVPLISFPAKLVANHDEIQQQSELDIN